MKKRLASSVTKVICILFVICTIISIFIVYKNIKNPYVIKFVIGYVIFVFFFLFYIGLITILNMRKLKWVEIRKRLCIFFLIFILLSASNSLFTYLIKGEVKILSHTDNAFGFAFGITFMDLLFTQKEERVNS